MDRVIAFVDGFNLYHSLADNPNYTKYKWLNIRKLLEVYVSSKGLRRRDRFCPNCKKAYVAQEEKQTDVNIAIHLFRLAIEDRYDTALIISGDSDLIPSIKAVKATFPSKKIGVLIPIGRRAEELKANCDFNMKIRERNLAKCQFNNPLPMPDGSTLAKPPTWS